VSRYRFIAEEKARHSVVRLCRVLGVAKSAFYAWQRRSVSARARTDAQLTETITAIYDQSRRTLNCAAVASGWRANGLLA
jgi:putative transposase